MATRRPSGKALPALALVILGASCVLLAEVPRLVDGYLALQWTRHFAARNDQEPRALDARPAGRWTARAVDGLAPLPQAWEAARLAMGFARRLQVKDAAAARALLAPVREAVERAEASWWRHFGAGELREEIWQLENSYGLDPDAGVVR